MTTPAFDSTRSERARLAWSAAYFFALLFGYFCLRPVREAAASVGGVRQLPWLMTATFVATALVVPVYAWLVARLPRRHLLPLVYGASLACLLAFYVLMRGAVAEVTVARVFYVWLSVYNLLVVATFWSFMADLWSSDQARRRYGVIAAAGSAGAISGPLLATLLGDELGPELLLVAAAALAACIACALVLGRHAHARGEPGEPVASSVAAGLAAAASHPQLRRLTLQTLGFTALATLLYLEHQGIAAAAIPDRGLRTELFASLDLVGNLVTLIGQAGLFALVARRPHGLTWALAAVPLLTAAGFVALWLAPTLLVASAFQVARRAAHQALERPAREVLFTGATIDRAARYQTKAFIDTVVYRGGDMLTGWLHAAVLATGAGLAGVVGVALPLTALGAVLAGRLAHAHLRKDPSA